MKKTCGRCGDEFDWNPGPEDNPNGHNVCQHCEMEIQVITKSEVGRVEDVLGDLL